MLKGINTTDPWLTIGGGYSSSSIYIDSSKVQQGIAGQVRYNGVDFQINDGSTWQTLSGSYATVNTSLKAQEAIQWVIKKMEQEQEAEALAKDNPAVKIALDNLERARQQLNATILLSKDYDKTTTS